MIRSRAGFTLVELVVVIVVIGILASIGILGFSQYQAQARDAIRASRATTIAESLEKYYDYFGEYPACSAVTGEVDSVASGTLMGVDTQVLTTPKGSGNSISCTDLTSMSGPDSYAYTGDTSVACQGSEGSSCALFVLKYKNEATNEIESIKSRRSVSIRNCSPIPNDPCVVDLNATATNFNAIDTSWVGINEAVSYELQYATNASFTSPTTLSVSGTDSTRTVSSLSYCTDYYFRIRAVGAADSTVWTYIEGNPATKTWCLETPEIAVTVPTTSSMTVTWDAIDNAASYDIKTAPTTGGLTGATPVNVTSPTRTYTGLSVGTQYCYTVQAKSGGFASSWSAPVCETIAVCVPVNVVATTSSTTAISVTWSAPSGCTPGSYNLRYSTSSSFTSSTTQSSVTSPRSVSSLTPGTRYYFQIQAVVSGTPGNWSSSANAITNISTPSASASTTSTTAITVSWGSISGATGYTIHQSTSSSFSTYSTFTTASTSRSMTSLTPGKTYYFRVQATGANKTSSWSSTVNDTTNISTPSSPTLTVTPKKYGSNSVGSENIDSGSEAWVPAESGSTWYPTGGSGAWSVIRATVSGSCPSGTTKQYYMYYRLNDNHGYGTRGWSTRTAWYGIRNMTDGSQSGGKFGARVRCAGSNATSSQSGITYSCVWRDSTSTSCGSPR